MVASSLLTALYTLGDCGSETRSDDLKGFKLIFNLEKMSSSPFSLFIQTIMELACIPGGMDPLHLYLMVKMKEDEKESKLSIWVERVLDHP